MHKSFNKYLGVFAGVATAGLMVLTIPAQAHGDTRDATGTEININKDTYQKYFATDGLAKYDPTSGVLTFPESVYKGDPANHMIYVDGHAFSPVKHSDGYYYIDLNGHLSRVNPANSQFKFNWINAVGQAYTREKIDLRKDFSLRMKIKVIPSNVDSKDRLGNGLSLSFRLKDPKSMGIDGAGLGIGNLEGVFGLIIDNSAIGAPAAETGEIPTIQLFKSNATDDDLNDSINDDTDNIQFLGNPDTISADKYAGKNLSLSIDWKAADGALSYAIKGENDKDPLAQGKQHLLKYLEKQHSYVASFAIVGSNGKGQANDQIQIQEIKYSPANTDKSAEKGTIKDQQVAKQTSETKPQASSDEKPAAVKPVTKSASPVKSGQVTHPSTGVSLPTKPTKTSVKTTATPTQKTTSSTNSSSSSSVKTPAVDSGSVQSTRDGLPEGTVRENTEVYAVKGISLYRHADFKKSQRITHYTKKSRRNWPKFLVTGYARSASGELRYQVKDINRHHKTYGKKGYITADRKFVRPVFYDKKHAKVKVVRLTGITAYHNRELTSKAAHYRYGKVLHVKRLVREHGKTCFVLTNGEYILADRKLVDLK